MSPRAMEVEWREASIEAFAAAWYRIHGFREGGITPRWEFTDRIVRDAWLNAARRYVDGAPLRLPRLRMTGDHWVEIDR